jgi:hypothetical protein
MTRVSWLQDEWQRDLLAARRVITGVAAPWGRAAGFIDLYEAGIRFTSDGLRAVGRVVDVEPVRTIAAISADLTRDIGAAQVSGVRWLLDA